MMKNKFFFSSIMFFIMPFSLQLNMLSHAQSLSPSTLYQDQLKRTNTPPEATKKPIELTMHNDTRVDNYAWLRDSKWPEIKNPEILKHIKNENHYTTKYFDYLSELQEKLYLEIKDRIKEDESTYPIQDGGYLYYKRYERGENYIIHCRKKVGAKNEEILLDENKLAKGKKYFSLGAISMSHDHQSLTYSTDESGQEIYTLRIKDLKSGELLPDVLDNVAGGAVIWHKKERGFFYLKYNSQQRPDCVYFHKIGDLQSKDLLVYKEKDDTFMSGAGIRYSSDQRYVFFDFGNSETFESLFIDLESKNFTPQLLIPRKQGHRYTVDHINNYFYMKTNDKGLNYRLVRISYDKFHLNQWEEVIGHSEFSYLTDFYLYQDQLVYKKLEDGLAKIIIYPFSPQGRIEEVNFPKDAAYEANIDFTRHDDTFLRIRYSSLITPDSVYEYDFKNKELHLRQSEMILGGFSSSDYQVERIKVPSKDGTPVPISLVYKKAMKSDKGNPILLDGYGSYGISNDVSFSFKLLSLLDRGFIYAIAHVRGGTEMGYYWYEDGKLLKKKNTFDDFISASEYLIEKGYTQKKKIAILASSAGGILAGYCANERPDLYGAVIARVPFVDVLNTMLDSDLTLTPGEFKEWGNPKEEKFYDYIKSYSPYDNVKVQEYPHMYVTAGLSDPRVTYWEPLKWVAKLREFKTDKNILLLDMKTEGHFGSSGRFSYIRDEAAKHYAFLLTVFDIEKVEIKKGFVETCRQMLNKVIKRVRNIV